MYEPDTGGLDFPSMRLSHAMALALPLPSAFAGLVLGLSCARSGRHQDRDRRQGGARDYLVENNDKR